MDAAATSKAWAAAADSLKHKNLIESGCHAICSLASQPAPHGAARKAVIKHGLPQAMFAVLNTVLGERRRQRDWRAAAYAARVELVAAAGIEVLAVADMLQRNLVYKRTSAASSSSSRSVTDHSRSSRDGASSALTKSVSDALWDQLLPKLALALQENAVLAEAAVSGGRSDSNASKSSSSAPARAAASMRLLSLRLLQLALAAVVGMARSIIAADHLVAVAEPAARLAMAALAGATAQDAAVASGIVTICNQLGRHLMYLQLRVTTEQSSSDGAGQGVDDSRLGNHMRKLLHSPHYG
jgi:hypothetical protein